MSPDRPATLPDDAIARMLRERALRVTPQRRAILQAFRASGDEHLSADEVLARASAAVPEIGRGTVYSTLAELTELGLLASVGNPEPVRYETKLHPHDHFHCRLCLRLFDVEMGGRELGERPLAGYAIETIAVRAHGVCLECKEYERGLSAGASHVRRRATVDGAAAAELTCGILPSPVGKLALGASSNGVARIAFEDHADFSILAERARTRRGPVAGRRRVTHLATTLADYFAGSRAACPDEVDWRFCTPHAATALASVHEIAYAEPRSYNRLDGGLSAFDCGYTMGSNPVPLLIPCHRVCRGDQRPEAYSGGPERLRLLRQLETG